MTKLISLRMSIWSQSAVIHVNEEYKYVASDPFFLKYFPIKPQASEHHRFLETFTIIEYCAKRDYLTSIIPTYVTNIH